MQDRNECDPVPLGAGRRPASSGTGQAWLGRPIDRAPSCPRTLRRALLPLHDRTGRHQYEPRQGDRRHLGAGGGDEVGRHQAYQRPARAGYAGSWSLSVEGRHRGPIDLTVGLQMLLCGLSSSQSRAAVVAALRAAGCVFAEDEPGCSSRRLAPRTSWLPWLPASRRPPARARARLGSVLPACGSWSSPESSRAAPP